VSNYGGRGARRGVFKAQRDGEGDELGMEKNGNEKEAWEWVN
jgi:hypothetical protein